MGFGNIKETQGTLKVKVYLIGKIMSEGGIVNTQVSVWNIAQND